MWWLAWLIDNLEVAGSNPKGGAIVYLLPWPKSLSSHSRGSKLNQHLLGQILAHHEGIMFLLLWRNCNNSSLWGTTRTPFLRAPNSSWRGDSSSDEGEWCIDVARKRKSKIDLRVITENALKGIYDLQCSYYKNTNVRGQLIPGILFYQFLRCGGCYEAKRLLFRPKIQSFLISIWGRHLKIINAWIMRLRDTI